MTVEIPRFLTDTQADLVRGTEPKRMEKLDEDELLELHTRVRRARSKYVKLYRQTGASRVGMKGARGHARPGNAANAAKAEVFELALARVSARVDVVARAAAEDFVVAVACDGRRSGVDRPRLPAGRWPIFRQRREHPSPRHEDHGRGEARRVLSRQGCCAPGEEGLPLTAGDRNRPA